MSRYRLPLTSNTGPNKRTMFLLRTLNVSSIAKVEVFLLYEQAQSYTTPEHSLATWCFSTFNALRQSMFKVYLKKGSIEGGYKKPHTSPFLFLEIFWISYSYL